MFIFYHKGSAPSCHQDTHSNNAGELGYPYYLHTNQLRSLKKGGGDPTNTTHGKSR